MNLDVRSMIFMAVTLSFALSGLLAMASLNAGNIRGIKQWALANLLYGGALAMAFTPLAQSPWVFVISNPMIAAAAGLQINGIKAFQDTPSDWRIPLGLALVSLVLNYYTCIVEFSITLRVLSNSLLVGSIYVASTRALFAAPITGALRTAYRLTGVGFAILAFLAFSRIISILFTLPTTNYLMSPEPINLVTFFVFSAMLLLITFGFILMLNYRLAAELKLLASHDCLTNALNRRTLEEVGIHLQAHHERCADHFSALMLDIDHFKMVNDCYGHPVGDVVLQELSTVARHTIRTGDYFARYGGEEFCILLPSTTEEQAYILADRLRQAFSDVVVNCGGGTILHCTVSIGVSDTVQSGFDFKKLIAEADEAMYYAKQNGRNRVVTASKLKSLRNLPCSLPRQDLTQHSIANL
jgi:diguanylate cyclase